MKRRCRFATLLLCVPLAAATGDTLRFGRFAAVDIHRPADPPARVVLWLSDATGWDADAAATARVLATGGAVVVGIDTPAYLKVLNTQARGCLYPAADIEALSQQVQQHLGLARYVTPLLAGRGAGAALAFATLAQAPIGTFAGALSIDYCPTLALARAPCRGNGLEAAVITGGFHVTSAKRLTAPWLAVSTPQAHCTAKALAAEVQAAGGALRKLARPAEPATVAGLVTELNASPPPPASATALTDLPLIEVSATGPPGNMLAVIVSGDGGWAGLDRELAAALATRGYPVVGLNSLQYFWKRRTPDEAGRDLARLLRHYLARWGKQRALLIGYSRGADVLPFMASRLPADLRARIAVVAQLGPGTTVEFEFHVGDWLRSAGRPAALPVAPEVEKLRGLKLLCVYGADESDSLCPQLPPPLARIERLSGGHHFGGDYPALARLVLDTAAPPP